MPWPVLGRTILQSAPFVEICNRAIGLEEGAFRSMNPYFSHSFVARRGEGCSGKARPDFPAGLYENILSKGKSGRNEAGAGRSKP